jgi:hypothetical protein
MQAVATIEPATTAVQLQPTDPPRCHEPKGMPDHDTVWDFTGNFCSPDAKTPRAMQQERPAKSADPDQSKILLTQLTEGLTRVIKV